MNTGVGVRVGVGVKVGSGVNVGDGEGVEVGVSVGVNVGVGVAVKIRGKAQACWIKPTIAIQLTQINPFLITNDSNTANESIEKRKI
jgi:hypothetical protein